jgi:hypothetical protein
MPNWLLDPWNNALQTVFFLFCYQKRLDTVVVKLLCSVYCRFIKSHCHFYACFVYTHTHTHTTENTLLLLF